MKPSEKEFRSAMETALTIVKDLGGEDGAKVIKILGMTNYAVDANDMQNVFLGYTSIFFLLADIISKKEDEIRKLRGSDNSN